VIHVVTAPPLVGEVVPGVVAIAAVSNHHNNGGIVVVAHRAAIQPLSIAVGEVSWSALYLFAFPAVRDQIVKFGGRFALKSLAPAQAGSHSPAATRSVMGHIRDSSNVPTGRHLLVQPAIAAGALVNIPGVDTCMNTMLNSAQGNSEATA
jgi:hypothetical protein